MNPPRDCTECWAPIEPGDSGTDPSTHADCEHAREVIDQQDWNRLAAEIRGQARSDGDGADPDLRHGMAWIRGEWFLPSSCIAQIARAVADPSYDELPGARKVEEIVDQICDRAEKELRP